MELITGAPVYGGYCLYREDGVILIKGAVPGERVFIEIREKKRDYAIADVIDVTEPSEDRVEPRCEVYGRCGGCHYQHISYERQLTVKQEIVGDCMERIGKTEIPITETIFGNEWRYKHKAQFKVSDTGRIGFFKEGSRELVSFKQCHIIDKEINLLLKKIRPKDLSGGVRELHIIKGENTLAFIKGKELNDSLLDCLIGYDFHGVVYEDGRIRGNNYSYHRLNDFVYTVSPQGFFQTNWRLNTDLIRQLPQWIGNIEGKSVLDIYGGAGNFSLSFSKTAKEVIVIEENKFSVEDGRRNSDMNEIRNVRFISKKFEKAKIDRHIDLAFINPPRMGLTNEAFAKLLSISPDRIAYLSCNPATFARDSGKLSDTYTISSLRLIDMFPHTYHCEVLGIFDKK